MQVIAVDVGTTSVRLAIIEFTGVNYCQAHVITSHEKMISHHQDGVKFEQSTQEVWQAICECCSYCVKQPNVEQDQIKSIAFSSTCSLVIQDDDSGDYERDIIMWMDHRSIDQANEVNQGKSEVLNQFGGVCSPEFSLAKLLWLRKHQPKRLDSAKALFELPDWLVYQSIRGEPERCPRSLCSLTCKWGYDAVLNKHCDIIEAFKSGLKAKAGIEVLKPGTISGYLCPQAARELGLMAETSGETCNKENQNIPKITVATSLIDAHSGMLAMLSVPLESYGIKLSIESTFCSLAGTSTCHLLLSRDRNFKHGIWGPYKDVVLDGYNLLEPGQSLTGKLIEICIESSHEGKRLLEQGKSMKQIINDLNEQINDKNRESPLHLLPTFHGNRSPLANPRLKGGLYGLTAEREAELLELYVATVESIIFETGLIVERLGVKLSAILVSGGLMKNKFFMQTLADFLGCMAIKMSLQDVDFMVMGSGLTARCAAMNAIKNQNSEDVRGEPLTEKSIADINYGQLNIDIFKPDEGRAPYLKRKYACYKEFVEFSLRVDRILHA